MSTIVDITSFNQDKIKADIDAWINSQPDKDKWTEFFASSVGQNIKDLWGGLAAFLKYDSTMARRENFMNFAQNRSSIIGIAQSLGYSAFRGRNAVLKLTITPASSGIYQKYDDIGSVQDRRLIVLETKAFNAGISTTITVAVAELAEEILIAPDSNLNVFHFTKTGVSEDIRLFFDSTEVELSTDVVDLTIGKASIQSNAFGSVDMKYLNTDTFNKRYQAGTPIKLQWLDLKDSEFTLVDVSLDEGQGELTDASIVSIYKAPESNVSIKVNAPLKNETKNAVRGRKDQAKIFKQLDSRILDAQGADISAAVMEIFYLLENEMRLTPAEKADFQDNYEGYRPFGLMPPYIEDADRAKIKLKFTIYLQKNTAGNITEAIDSIKSVREKMLGVTINLFDMEQELEDLDFIRVARIEITANTWASLTRYELGSFVKASPDNGKVYQVNKILYRSGATEPTWSASTLVPTDDGHLKWQAVPKNDLAGIVAWMPNELYTIGSIVKPSTANGYVYQAVKSYNFSGSTEPVWPTLSGGTPLSKRGAMANDGDLVWIARPLEGTVTTWTANKNYEKGECVVSIDPTLSDTSGLMFQAYAYRGRTSSVLPAFPTTEDQLVTDGNVEWKCVNPKAEEITLGKSQYWIIEPDTTVV